MASFFVNYVLPALILVLGSIGNTFGLILIGRKKLDKIGPILVYKLLFIWDTLFLRIYILHFIIIFFKSLKKRFIQFQEQQYSCKMRLILIQLFFQVLFVRFINSSITTWMLYHLVVLFTFQLRNTQLLLFHLKGLY